MTTEADRIFDRWKYKPTTGASASERVRHAVAIAAGRDPAFVKEAPAPSATAPRLGFLDEVIKQERVPVAARWQQDPEEPDPEEVLIPSLEPAQANQAAALLAEEYDRLREANWRPKAPPSGT